MSHALVHGEPTESQLHLDSIIQEVGCSGSFTALMHHTLKKHPDRVMMINARSKKSFTNGEILARSVRVSRAITARGLTGSNCLFLMRDHEDEVAVYFGAMMAGLLPLVLEPVPTSFELEQFFELTKPKLIFCEEDCLATVAAAAKTTLDEEPDVIVVGEVGNLAKFVDGHDDSIDNFQPVNASSLTPLQLMPTSGSTGALKAAVITHGGLVAKLPDYWTYFSKFPQPVDRVLLLSSPQWMTHLGILSSMPIYGVTLVMTGKVSPQRVLELCEEYKINWILMSPTLAHPLSRIVEPRYLKWIKMIICCGAAASSDALARIQECLPADGYIRQGYGCTELQGFVTYPSRETDLNSIGKKLNNVRIKILVDDEREAGVNEPGQLYLASEICLIKSYYKNPESYAECVKGSWYQTGDVVRRDEQGNIYFVQRSKFCFKYNNYQVSPEELEAVVGSVPGVQLCCISDSGAGAAALVVGKALREDIHRVVNEKLQDYKRLHGGIAFVTSLPLTRSSKLDRRACHALLQQMIQEGKCITQ